MLLLLGVRLRRSVAAAGIAVVGGATEITETAIAGVAGTASTIAAAVASVAGGGDAALGSGVGSRLAIASGGGVGLGVVTLGNGNCCISGATSATVAVGPFCDN